MSDSECSSDDGIPLAQVRQKIKEVLEIEDREFINDIIENVIRAVFETTHNDISEKYCLRKRKIKDLSYTKCKDSDVYHDSDQDSEISETAAESDEEFYDSDKDPAFAQSCEVRKCKKEVWAACHKCLILVCWEHFNEEVNSCKDHGLFKKAKNTKMPYDLVSEVTPKKANKTKKSEPEGSGVKKTKLTELPAENVVGDASLTKTIIPEELISEETPKISKTKTFSEECVEEVVFEGTTSPKLPEEYFVEGAAKETPHNITRKEPKHYKNSKKKRDKGEAYWSPYDKKLKAPRTLKQRCNCKSNLNCKDVPDEVREKLFKDYWAIGSLQTQREFIFRHVETSEIGRKTTEGVSRRKLSKKYFLHISKDKKVRVCQTMFLNTLGISEKTARTAIEKMQESGVLASDNRGGRTETAKIKDAEKKEAMLKHIKRFPQVESHYCRSNTKRLYVSEDLSFKKMYKMFKTEWDKEYKPPPYESYLDLCKEENISIHHPKKDQCSLCNSYRKGDDAEKENLKEQFDCHILEKNKVRQLKENCKKESIIDQSILSAVFDLQQVIYLPISKDSQIFYKRRLANYNFTVYNIATKECDCFVWNEGQGKRGSSEMSTGVAEVLKFYDDKGVKKAYLFADGCGGQNKNSIFPAMMLHIVLHSKNLKQVSLRYFVTSHGQSEGDSVHSAVTHAIKNSGDVFQTVQLETIIQSARSNHPYRVHLLDYDKFLDYKTMSRELRILQSRTEKVDWGDIMEVMVTAENPDRIFFKTCHSKEEF